MAFNKMLNKSKIVAEYQKATRSLARIGELLILARNELDKESFTEHIDTLPFSRSCAYNYIRLHEHTQNVSELDLSRFAITALYNLPPDSVAMDKALNLAKNGKKIDVATAQMILKSVKVENPKTVQAWIQASQDSPKHFAESMERGAVTNPITGDDETIAEADSTLVYLASHTDEYERIQRQKNHIAENAGNSAEYTGMIAGIAGSQIIIQVDGESGELDYATLIGKSITVYVKKEIENETEKEKV